MPPPLRAGAANRASRVVRYPSFSPDGNHVAFTWTGPKQDNPDVYVQQIGAGAPLRLTQRRRRTITALSGHPTGAPSRSCDSDPTRARHELRLIPPLGGTERKLTEIQAAAGISPCGNTGLVSGFALPRGHRCFISGREEARRFVRRLGRDWREAAIDEPAVSGVGRYRSAPCRPTAAGSCSAATSRRFPGSFNSCNSTPALPRKANRGV